MRRLSDGRIVHVEVAADGPYDHLAAIQPDPDMDGYTASTLDLHRILFDRRLHGQGRIAGPDGRIFMGDRRAKQRHNPIAHDLIHRALIAMHRRHHAFRHRVEDLAGLFGVTVGQQFHRAFKIGKQHRHLLAFAFEGGFGGEDLLGQVGWCGGLRPLQGGGERLRARGWGGLREACPALAAERKAGRILKVTMRAAWAELGPAATTKIHPRRILKSAARAAHRPHPPGGACRPTLIMCNTGGRHGNIWCVSTPDANPSQGKTRRLW